MGASGRGANEPISGVNMTPLVDIMLVLLVIFIVTARVAMQPAVAVNLPKAAQTEDARSILVIAVPAEGPLVIDGAPMVDDDAIVERARAARARDPELRALIHGDAEARHAAVMRVLDLLERAGIERVAFAASPVRAGAE